MAAEAAVLTSGAPVESPTEKPWKGVLSKEKVGLIQSSYEEVIEKVTGPGFGKEFYTVLFDTVPEAKALFKQKREVQEKMFADTLTLLVKNIDDAEKTVPELTTLATRHVRYGVQEAHFPPVGGSLLGTLEKILGPSFTPAVREAWTELWGTATADMKLAKAPIDRRSIPVTSTRAIKTTLSFSQWDRAPLHAAFIFPGDVGTNPGSETCESSSLKPPAL